MKDQDKERPNLVAEVARLRRRVEELEAAEAQRQGIEAALQESEGRYRSIVENSDDAIFLTAPDGRILTANAAACRMFGRTENEICQLGRAAILNASDPRLSHALETRSATGKFKGELTHLRRDGQLFPGEGCHHN